MRPSLDHGRGIVPRFFPALRPSDGARHDAAPRADSPGRATGIGQQELQIGLAREGVDHEAVVADRARGVCLLEEEVDRLLDDAPMSSPE